MIFTKKISKSSISKNPEKYYNILFRMAQQGDPKLSSILSINDNDKNAFMTTIHGSDRTKGLDLVLHTPGGDLAATESLVELGIKFDLGLGSGLDILFKHLSRNVKDGNLALARGDKRSEYDVGIGFGIGYMWQYQNQGVVSESFLRMASNNGFLVCR